MWLHQKILQWYSHVNFGFGQPQRTSWELSFDLGRRHVSALDVSFKSSDMPPSFESHVMCLMNLHELNEFTNMHFRFLDPQVACFLFSSQNPIRFPWSDGSTQQTFKFSWASLLKIPSSGTHFNQTRLLWFWELDTNQTRTGVIPVGQSQNIKNPLLWWNSVPKRRQTA